MKLTSTLLGRVRSRERVRAGAVARVGRALLLTQLMVAAGQVSVLLVSALALSLLGRAAAGGIVGSETARDIGPRT